MNLARIGNKYLADNEPWKLIKTDKKRTGEILNNSLQIAAHLSILLAPFLPSTSNKIAGLLNLNKSKLSWDAEDVLLKSGHQINKAELLFAKIEDWEIETQIEKLQKAKEKAQSISNI